MIEVSRMLKFAGALLFFCALTACDSEVPQVVSGKFEPSFGPTPVMVLLFEGSTCGGTSIQSAVFRTGEFSFQLSSTKGGVGVVTQELSLCAAGESQPLWYSRHGGGASAIKLVCRRPPDEEGLCASSFEYGVHGA